MHYLKLITLAFLIPAFISSCNSGSEFGGKDKKKSNPNADGNGAADVIGKDVDENGDGDSSGESGDGDNKRGSNAPTPAGEIDGNQEDKISPEARQIYMDCKNADLKTLNAVVTFKKNNEGCLYNQNVTWPDGVTTIHLGRENGFYQAIRRDPQSVEVPEGSTICNLDMKFNDTKDLRIDDIMFMTVNENLLLSTFDLNKHFTMANNIYEFSWDNLRGQEFKVPEKEKGLGYCLGIGDGTECELPPHDDSAQMSVTLAPLYVYELSAKIKETRKLDFVWVVTGDNDTPDCEHTQDVSINVDISYFQ